MKNNLFSARCSCVVTVLLLFSSIEVSGRSRKSLIESNLRQVNKTVQIHPKNNCNDSVKRIRSAPIFKENKTINDGVNEINGRMLSYVDGDFKTRSDGIWSNSSSDNTSEMWMEMINGTWVDVLGYPAYNNSLNSIYIAHNVTLNGNNSAKSITIENGGQLSTSTVSATFKNLLVKNGGIFNKQSNGTKFDSDGILEVEDGGTMTFKRTDSTSHSANLWAGTEKFHPNSNFIIVETDEATGDGRLITENMNSISKFNGAYFGNVIVEMTKGKFPILPNSFNGVLAAGDLIFRKSSDNGALFSGDYNAEIKGSLIVDATYSDRVLLYNPNSNSSSTLNVNGNIINNSNIALVSIGSGFFHVNLKGNLYISAEGGLNSSSSLLNFNFIGTEQNVEVANQSSLAAINFAVKNGAYVRLKNQNLNLGTNSVFNVESGGIFDFGFNSFGNALNVLSHGNGQKFNALSGSILKITSPFGITKTAGVGNVQTPVSNRSFHPRAIYHYKGRANQVTGNGLPSGITGRVIVDLQTDETNENLTFNSSGTTSFGTTNEINGVLEIRRGKVIDAPSSGFRNYSGTIDDDNDGENDLQRGDLVMTGGRYVVSGGGTKPALSGTYTLTGGTVEFAGSGNTRIRVKPLYNSIAISGSNIVAGGKNLEVNNITKILQDGKLTIPETLDSESSYVLTSKKGLLNEAGVLLFGSGAQLMQDSDAINEGEISMLRKTKMQKMDYTYWSSPVVGQSLSTFSVGTPWNRRYEYREQDDLFTPTLDSHFQPAKGYAIRGKDAWDTTTEDVFAFSGIPINASTYSQNGGEVDLVRQIQKSKNTFINGEEYEHGYTLIRNPYPSNLSFYQFLDKPVNGLKNADIIHPKAWLWTNASPQLYMEGSTYNGNNYAIISYAGGVSPTYQAPSDGVNPFTQYLPTSSIKVGQGFIVQMKGNPPTGDIPNTATLRFSNDMRDTKPGVFYNNVGLARSQSIDRYWLQLKSPSNIYNTVLIAHTENATDDYDEEYDAELFSIGQDSFYTEVDAFKLQIDARPLFQSSQIIPLSTQYSEDGIYTIVLQKPEGVFESLQDIYLRDKLLDVVVNLKVKGYNFLTNAGIVQGRFEIVYEPKNTLGLFENYNNAVGVIRDGENFIIQSSDIIHDVEIYDASGRLMQKVEANKKQVLIDGSLLNTGVYFLKMYSNSGSVFKKVRK